MSGLPSTTYANPTTPYFAAAGSGGGGSTSNWSTFPAVSPIDASGNIIKNISSLQIDAQVLTANASSLFLNGVAIATIPDISNVEDWSLYPALADVDMSGFNISGAGAGSFTSLSINGVPVSAGSASNWATFGAVTDINVSGNAINAAASVQVGNRTLTTAAGTANAPYLLLNGSNILSNWSTFTANTAVSLGMNDINNAKDINASGTILTNAVTTNNLTLSTAVITTLGPVLLVNGLNNTSNWSAYQANHSLDMASYPIFNTPEISISGTTQNVVLTAAGTQLLVDGQPVYTGALPPSDVSNWANYPAVTNLNMSGFYITGGSTSLKIQGDCKVSNDLEVGDDLKVNNNIDITSGGITQCNVVGDGTTNKFAAATTFGDSADLGYVEVKGANRVAGFSSFYVEGGVTFDGGNVHGVKMTSASAGIFGLARFELTPLLIYIASAGPITLASVTYTIIAALLNVRVAAGTFVTIEHGNVGGFDGIYLQNTLNVASNTRFIWTAGGTQYNTGVVQTSNLFTPQPVQFWSNVYNPSGGSTPVPPSVGAYPKNPIVYNDVNRTNNLLGNWVGWFGALGAYEASPLTTYASLSTFSGTTLIGNFPSVGNTTGVTPYNFGNSSIHIGEQTISADFATFPPTLGDRAVAIGTISGWTGAGTADNIILGTHTNGIVDQGSNCIAIGVDTGMARQETDAIAIGAQAGQLDQQSFAVAIGTNAGNETQGDGAVAIGLNAGATLQSTNSVAIGNRAGQLDLGVNSVAIGSNAGSNFLGSNSVAIGGEAGRTGSGTSVVAIGYRAGSNNLGSNSIAIGALSATGGMGEFSTYIGTANTIEGAVPTNTIVLNNTGLAMNPANANAFYVGKLRNIASSAGFNMTAHNNGTGEFIQTLTSSLSLDDTISNTQRISYDTGLLTTQIDGLLKVAGSAEFTQSVTANTTLDVLGLTTLSSLVIQNLSAGTSAKAVYYNPSLGILTQADVPLEIVAAPAFVYYVATNGRAGGSGAITDPLSTINEALTKPASSAPDKPGMTIYVAPGEYFEDVVINLTLTLPAVAIVGMADDTDDSKRVQIRGSVAISGTFVGAINSVNVVMLNSIAVFAKNATTSAVSITGAGVRTYLKNGLYTTPHVATTIPLISLSSTGATSNTINQLVIDNCSVSIGAATASTNIINVASGQIFQILFSDLTNLGTGLCINMAGGAFTEATQSRFNARNAVLNIVSSAAALTSLTQCLVSGRASTSVALITLGTNANLNANDNTIQNLDTTTEVNNTSRYIYTTSATGNLIAAIRNNITNSRAAVTQITPFQAATPAASQLLYFGNIYTNSTATLVGNLPAQGGANWNAVRQFNTDTYTQQIQVVATSASAIVLTPAIRGRTFILTGTTTQAFSTAGFGVADAGFFVIAHNGNASSGGDINLTGMTGTTIIHEQKATQNGGDVYLYWNGTGLVGY